MPSKLTGMLVRITKINPSVIDHNLLKNLTVGDPHTQYAYLTGRAGGQTLYGGTGSGNDLLLESTSHATKGQTIIEQVIELEGGSTPSVKLMSSDALSYFALEDSSATIGKLVKSSDSGDSFINIDPIPEDGTSDSTYRIFRGVNTSGLARVDFYLGDGTATKNASIGGNADTSFCLSTGDFGIGIASPTEKLHVVGDIRATATYTSTTASAANMFVDSTGKYFRSTSSRKYKRNVRDLGLDPSAIFNLRPKSFESPEDRDETFFGLIAEEVHDICPELVGYKPIYDETPIEHSDIEFNKTYSGDSKLEPITTTETHDTGEKEWKEVNGVLREVAVIEEVETLTGWNEFPKIDQEPDWVMYDRLPVLMLPVIRELRDRSKTQADKIVSLENEVQTLKDAFAELTTRVNNLDGGIV